MSMILILGKYGILVLNMLLGTIIGNSHVLYLKFITE